MTIAMYHPNLEPPDNTCVALTEDQALIYEQSGWVRAPEATEREGYEPEPVTYAPVEPEKTKAAKSSRARSAAAESAE